MLVFAGLDPSGGAGLAADVQAIAAAGAHALPVATVLTAQDNNRVRALHAIAPELVRVQADALIASIAIAAVKIGIVGSLANAHCIAAVITELRSRRPDLPVVLDPVLASGQGDALAADDPLDIVAVLMPFVTLLTPNLPEAAMLCTDTGTGTGEVAQQAAALLARGASHVLIKGGHDAGEYVVNRWFATEGTQRSWKTRRLAGSFHGSGCTLASSIAGHLAQQEPMEIAIDRGLGYCQQSLSRAFAIGAGQLIPQRTVASDESL